MPPLSATAIAHAASLRGRAACRRAQHHTVRIIQPQTAMHELRASVARSASRSMARSPCSRRKRAVVGHFPPRRDVWSIRMRRRHRSRTGGARTEQERVVAGTRRMASNPGVHAHSTNATDRRTHPEPRCVGEVELQVRESASTRSRASASRCASTPSLVVSSTNNGPPSEDWYPDQRAPARVARDPVGVRLPERGIGSGEEGRDPHAGVGPRRVCRRPMCRCSTGTSRSS